MPDDFDRDQPSAVELAYIGWRRTLSFPIYSVEDAERAIQEAFRYAWALRSAKLLDQQPLAQVAPE